MTIIDRYLTRAVIGGSLLVLMVLMALTAFVALVGQFASVGTGDYGLSEAIIYVLLSLPRQAVEMMPVAVLIGSLLALGTLASQNELTVMRAAGMPIARIGRGAVFGGVILAAACVLLGEWVAPPAERYAGQLRAQALHQSVNILGRDGAWLRDGRQYINARRARDTGQLEGLHVYEFDEEGQLLLLTRAAQARYDGERWELQGVQETRPGPETIEAEVLDARPWRTGIGPELLALVSVSPDMLSASGLYDYIRYLEGNNLDADQYRIAFWFKLVIPAALPVMVLLAMPFLFGSLRSSGAGQRLVVGLVIGIAFYLVNITLSNIGAILAAPPFLIAWAPTLLLLAISLGVIRRL